MTDDIDDAFQQWARGQMKAAAQDVPEILRGPAPPARHSRDIRILAAVIAVVLLVLGVSVATMRVSHRAANVTDARQCGTQVRPSALQSLGVADEVVDVDLTYEGAGDCTISLSPPRVTLTDTRGRVYPIQGVPVRTSSTMTLHRSEVLTLAITGFVCGYLARDRYTLHIYLGSQSATTAGITVLAGERGGSQAGMCGGVTNNGTVHDLQAGVGTYDHFTDMDTAQPGPINAVGRKWGLVQITDPIRSVSVPNSSRFTIQFSAGGQFSANDSVNDISGTYKRTSTGYATTGFETTLVGYGAVNSGAVPIVDFTAIRAIDAIARGRVVSRESGGFLELHAGGYTLIFRDIGSS